MTAARKLGGEIISLVIGSGVGAQAEELAKKGGGKVLLAEDPSLLNYNLDGWERAIGRAIEVEKPELVLLSSTPIGWDVAGRLAAQLDCAIATDVIKLETDGADLIAVRRMFNAKFDARIRLSGSPRVVTMQSGASEAYSGSDAGSVAKLDGVGGEGRTKFVEVRVAPAGGHDLTKAEIIVSGGRGLQKPENFEAVLKPLVDALGAQMGASRPVVDAGWLPPRVPGRQLGPDRLAQALRRGRHLRRDPAPGRHEERELHHRHQQGRRRADLRGRRRGHRGRSVRGRAGAGQRPEVGEGLATASSRIAISAGAPRRTGIAVVPTPRPT